MQTQLNRERAKISRAGDGEICADPRLYVVVVVVGAVGYGSYRYGYARVAECILS